jgi:hypothetical protein
MRRIYNVRANKMNICADCIYRKLKIKNIFLEKKYRYICLAPENQKIVIDPVTGERALYNYCYLINIYGDCKHFAKM